MKKLFFIISAIGFFTPFVLFFLLKIPNDDIKIYTLYMLPKFNYVYFLIIILFFFGGLKFKWLQNAQILFIIFYFLFLNFKYFVISKQNVEKIHQKYKNSKIVKLSELKNIKNFQIIYKDGPFAVIVLKHKKNTNPFNYVKDKGNFAQ